MQNMRNLSKTTMLGRSIVGWARHGIEKNSPEKLNLDSALKKKNTL